MSQIEIQTDAPQKFAESFERYLAGVTEVADLAQMESWLDNELRCESSHGPNTQGWNDEGCSVKVTHRVASCSGEILICQSRADYLMLCMKRLLTCGRCSRWASECWKIIPV